MTEIYLMSEVSYTETEKLFFFLNLFLFLLSPHYGITLSETFYITQDSRVALKSRNT